jgi:hypothetical protein
MAVLSVSSSQLAAAVNSCAAGLHILVTRNMHPHGFVSCVLYHMPAVMMALPA